MFWASTRLNAMLLQYCHKGTLTSLLRSKGIKKFIRQLEMASKIAAGLVYLKQQRIIHRDLKSPNILLGMMQNIVAKY
jgi:serine/threonine protein kinase